jgi:hypothetical protein
VLENASDSSSVVRQPFAQRSRNQRAKVTNNPRRMAIDGRTPLGRRLRDIADQLADGLGGWSVLTELQAASVRKSAELQALAEDARARKLNGATDVTLDDLVRLDRLAEQSVRRLNLPSASGKPAAPAAPTFADIAAEAQADAARRRARELAADAEEAAPPELPADGDGAKREPVRSGRLLEPHVGDRLHVDDGREIEVVGDDDDPSEAPR